MKKLKINKLKVERLKINKKIRLSLIIILVLAALGMGYLIYEGIYIPKIEDEKVALFSYKSSGDINYNVHLKPNNLYTEGTMEEGKLYITEFVDYINANFRYNFTGDDTVDIKGNYNIVAKVQGFIEEKDKEIEIWERDFPLIEDKKFSLNENELSINESLNIYLDKYDVFAAEIIEASKIKSSRARLILLMDVNLQGVTGKGEFESNVSPNLIIPLGTSIFQITGDLNIEKPGMIEDTIQVELPVNKFDIILYGILLGVFILGIVFLLFFTEIAVDKDPFEKGLKKIFRKHGDRFVALDIDIENKNGKQVRTIEDLVRVADETNRPIFYKYSKDYREIDSFYVADGDEMYIFNVAESLSQDSQAYYSE